MNDLQARQFEILTRFVRVCEKLDLPYYLVCGSALGAVKYGGFIPWDDDIDVGLMRPDYEKFLAAAPALLPEWIFVQNYRTEKEFPLLMTKLRDSRTTAIETDFSRIPMHHGICIDVFPLDGYPQSKRQISRFEKKKKYFARRQFLRLMGKRGRWFLNLRSTGLWCLYRLFGYCRDTSRLLARYDRFLASYPVEGSRIICNHGNWQGNLEYMCAEQYGTGAIKHFEGLRVRVPEDYDAYLRQKYGYYTLEPPINRRKSHHSFDIVDTTKPYTEYTDT